jgi:hypothetical protein
MNKSIAPFLSIVAVWSSLSWAAGSTEITASQVNIQASQVTIAPSLSEQALVASYIHPWWINVGGGLTTGFHSEDAVNAGFNVSLNIQPFPHQMFTVRSAGADFIGGDYYDMAALYGLISRNQNGYVSAAAGVGAVFFERDFLGKNDNKAVAGVPLEMQAFWTPTPNFGLGLVGYLNINEEHSYYGMVLSLQLANLVPI